MKPLRVVQLSLHVKLGGAGRAATRLHAALLARGVESRFLTGSADDAAGIAAARPLRVGWRADLADGGARTVRERGASETQGLLWHLLAGTASAIEDALGSDGLVHLHWVEGSFGAPEVFAHIARRRGVLWTLHDTSAFTGYCGNPMGCDRFVEACGACPQIASTNPFDISWRTLARRRLAGRAYPDVVIAPSHWMARLARASRVMRNHDIRRVANGVDLQTFRPGDRRAARERLGLPEKAFLVVLLAAHPMLKGGDLLVAALAELARDGAMRNLAVVVAGASALEGSAVPVHHLGLLHDDAEVAVALQAADVVVVPSRFDNLPNAMIEGLASGIPVVAFDVGGVGDAVVDGDTGVLVPALDTIGFAAAIRRLADPELRERLGRGGRARAEREFDGQVQAGRIAQIYDEVQATRRAANNASVP